MKIKLSAVFLGVSVIFLVGAIALAIIGSSITSIYTQMKNSPIVTELSEINKYRDSGFLITGILENGRDIQLKNGKVTLDDGFEFSEKDVFYIRDGATVTIYSVDTEEEGVVKGYRLYEGNPKQYVTSLSTPLNSYSIIVNILIALGVLFFVGSIVLNIKK